MHMRTRIAMTALLAGLAFVAAALPAAAAGTVDYWLTVFHNNDGESDLLTDGENGGAARFITKLNEQRALVPNDAGHGCLTLSSGDNFLAGPEFNAGLNNGIPYYDTIALDMIGYDALCLGNHDFDFGPDVLADFISGYSGPVKYLSANLDFSGEPALAALESAGTIAASAVVTLDGRQIGVVGATTENLPFISSPRNVVVDAVAPAIQAEVAALSGAGVDIIIVISHLQNIAEDLALAGLLSDVDLMIAGGGDELLATPGDPVIPGDEGLVYGDYPQHATDAMGGSIPVVTTPGSYGYVGEIVLGFDSAGELVMVDDALSMPHRVMGPGVADGVIEDPAAVAAFVAPLEADLAAMAANVLAVSEVALDGIRNNVRSRETNQGDLIADALLWTAAQRAGDFGLPTPDVAFQNGGGIRNDEIVPAGDITELKTWDMVPFPNFVSIVPDVPRGQFKEILENAVSLVEFTSGRFAQVAGMSFVYDPDGTPQELDAGGNVVVAGARVISAMLADGTVLIDGGSVVPGPALTVATIDFLAGGGDQYPFRGAPFTRVGATYQQALQTFLTDALGGVIAAADYPVGGERRIQTLQDVANEETDPGAAPRLLALDQNYPNPFNPSTTIAFTLDRPGRVELKVFAVDGSLVRTLVSEPRTAGAHAVVWDGRDAAGQAVGSGKYLYRLTTPTGVLSRTMVLVK